MFARIKFSIGSTLRQNKLKEKVEKIRGGVINVKKGGKKAKRRAQTRANLQ